MFTPKLAFISLSAVNSTSCVCHVCKYSSESCSLHHSKLIRSRSVGQTAFHFSFHIYPQFIVKIVTLTKMQMLLTFYTLAVPELAELNHADKSCITMPVAVAGVGF